jgi:putative restriction endonuclease
LEAAHIMPYRGLQTHHPGNGLLLRADLHTLFDLGLIAIDGATMTVLVAPSLLNSAYASIAGKTLREPHQAAFRPSSEALAFHRQWSGL